MKRHRILLADDHVMVVQGLSLILNRPEFEILGSVTDGRALVRAAEELRPDVIVVDVSMPLMNGIEAVRQIREHDRKVKVVFLTMHPEVTYAREAMSAGASAYVLKSGAGDELVTAIEAVLGGNTYVTPSIADAVMKSVAGGGNESQRVREGLTPRQREILQLLAEGRSLKDIAALLHISPRTVEFHKYGVMEALGARTMADLVRYATKHGIVS